MFRPGKIPSGASTRLDDSEPLEGIFKTHGQPVFGYLARLTTDDALAECLTRATFVEVACQDNVGRPLPDRARVFEIATKLALSTLRRRQIRDWLRPVPLAAPETREPREPRIDGGDALAQALDQLSRADAAALLMHIRYDLSSAEVAVALGVSAPAALMRLCRARVALRDRYLQVTSLRDPTTGDTGTEERAACRWQNDPLLLYWELDRDGELDDGVVEEIARHLTGCEACRANLELDRQLGVELSALPEPILGPVRMLDLAERIRDDVRREDNAAPFRGALRVPTNVAAAAIGLPLLVLLLLTLVLLVQTTTTPGLRLSGRQRATALSRSAPAAGVPTSLPTIATPTSQPPMPAAVPALRVVETLRATLPDFPPLGSRPEGVTFVDQTRGWVLDGDCKAVGPNGCSILATVDGGAHWFEQFHTTETIHELFFVDSWNGWLLQSDCSVSSTGACPTAVFATTNGGNTWQQRTATAEDLSKLAFVDERHGWALGNACRSGSSDCTRELLRTADGGAHWAATPSLAGEPRAFAFVDARRGWVLACEDVACFRPVVQATGDAGSTWHQQYALPWSNASLAGSVDFSSASTGWIYLSPSEGCSAESCWGSLYRTTDSGQTWTQIQMEGKWRLRDWDHLDQDIFPSGFPARIHFVSDAIGWIPIQSGTRAGRGGIAMTNNGGATWFRLERATNWSVGDVAQQGPTNVWIVGSRRLANGYSAPFLMSSADLGGSWSQRLASEAPTSGVDFPEPNVGYGLGSPANPGAVLRTSDLGATWSPVAGVSNAVALSFVDSIHGWLAVAASKPPVNAATALPVFGPGISALAALHDGIIRPENLVVTDDGGRSWRTIFQSRDLILWLRFFNRDDGVMAMKDPTVAGDPSLLVTRDGGLTWSWQAVIPAEENLLALDFVDPSTGWLVTQPIPAYAAPRLGTPTTNVGPLPPIELRMTNDGGKHWNLVGAVDVFEPIHVALSFTSARDGWLGIGHAILQTQTAGERWTRIELPDSIDVAELSGTRDPRVAWLTTTDGRLFKTQDGGVTWREAACPSIVPLGGAARC